MAEKYKVQISNNCGFDVDITPPTLITPGCWIRLKDAAGREACFEDRGLWHDFNTCPYIFDYEAYMGNVAFCFDDYIEALDGYTGLLCLSYPAECKVSRYERDYFHIAGKCSYITPNIHVDPRWIDTLKDCNAHWLDPVVEGDSCEKPYPEHFGFAWYLERSDACLDPAITPYLSPEDENYYRATIGQRDTCCQGYIWSKATIGRSTIDLGDYPGYPVYSAVGYTDSSPLYSRSCLSYVLLYCPELRLCEEYIE